MTHSHTERLKPHGTTLHCGRLGSVEVVASPVQQAAMLAATGAGNMADALAALLTRAQPHFEALVTEYTPPGRTRPQGTLYLTLPTLGHAPLVVRFEQTVANNAEQLLEKSRGDYATYAALIAAALNTGREPLQVVPARQTSHAHR